MRVGGRLFCTVEAGVPWSMRGGPDPFATFHVLTEGQGFIRVHGHEPIPLVAGRIAMMPRGSTHSVSDTPDRPGVTFASMARRIDDHGRLRLGGDGPRSRVLCGAFHLDDRDAPPVFDLLPPVLVVDADPPTAATVALLAAEFTARSPGWRQLVARTVPILFVQVLRAWMRVVPDEQRGPLAALSDGRIARTLAAIHADPGGAWSVERMASVAAMSRSSFADRFGALLGRPPLRYVTAVRMQAAADALARTEAGLAEIAVGVGYRAEEAFCRSFKRHFGVTAGQWRRESRVAFTV